MWIKENYKGLYFYLHNINSPSPEWKRLDHKSRTSVDHENPQCQVAVYKAIVASNRIHGRSGSGEALAPLVMHSHSGQSWACVSMSRPSILNGAQEDEGGSE